MNNMINKCEFTVVTTFSQDGWNKYGHRFAKTMDMYLPENMKVLLYYEGKNFPEGFTDRMKFISFMNHCGEKQEQFELMEQDFKKVKGTKVTNEAEFKFQASRFSYKYYACEHAINTIDTKYLVWIDADVIALKNVPKNFFQKLVTDNSYWSRIGRGEEYPECGFMIWNRQHKVHKFYWKVMNAMYDKGQLFNLSEWHDSYVWWEAEKILHRTKNINIAFDLGDGNKGHAFVRGVLGEYFDHLKGQRKIFRFSPETRSLVHKTFYFLFSYSLRILKKIELKNRN